MATRVSIPADLSSTPSVESSRSAAASPSPGLQRFAWCVVAYNVMVILWGAVVRSTGSGNGCGEHWPLCGGTVVQHWRTLASVIEFAHRASVGVSVFALVGLVGWTWRGTMRRHLARVFVAAAVVLTFMEALLGALLVKLGLTGTNESAERAVVLSLHQANTLLMLAALALTAHFLSRQTGRMRGSVQLRYGLAASGGLLATLLVGVSGSLAALGDTLYPAHSLAQAFAQDFAAGSHWLLHTRWIHPMLSLPAAGWVLFLVVKSLLAGEDRRLPWAVAALVGCQIVLGVGDVLLLAPTWLQVTHLLGADLLWVSLVVLTARLCVRPIGCPGGGCVRAGHTA